MISGMKLFVILYGVIILFEIIFFFFLKFEIFLFTLISNSGTSKYIQFIGFGINY